MSILSEANQLILDNDMLLTIIAGLLSALIGLGVYIWKDRKKQLDLTATQQAELNKMFIEETSSIKDSHASIARTTAELSATMKEMSSFMKSTTKELRDDNTRQWKQINQNTADIKKIEGAILS